MERRKARRSARKPPPRAALGVGARLRHARLVRQYTLKDVARGANCSESMVSKVENDRLEPSLRVLHKLCSALQIGLGELFSDGNGGDPITTRPGERAVIELDPLRRGKGVRMERVIPYARGHLLQGNIHVVAPGGSSDGTISHQGEEVGYVIAGEIELVVDGKRYALAAGDSFYFASTLEHGYRNTGKGEARIFWINTPPTF